MSDIEITPELLEETKQQVKRGRHQFPSYVVLTLIEEVERLRCKNAELLDLIHRHVLLPEFNEQEEGVE